METKDAYEQLYEYVYRQTIETATEKLLLYGYVDEEEVLSDMKSKLGMLCKTSYNNANDA